MLRCSAGAAVAWRKQVERFPPRLREFREEDWPPVEGECLESYTCRALGYEMACVPAPGVPCGQVHYDRLAAEYPDRPELLAAAKRADAYTRFEAARLEWIGEDGDGYLDELIESWNGADAIRYAPFRGD